MKITVVQNGVNSICMVPETEMEILILKEMAKTEVTFKIHDSLQILDKVAPNVAVISSVVKPTTV
jgi:hypothetical protein